MSIIIIIIIIIIMQSAFAEERIATANFKLYLSLYWLM